MEYVIRFAISLFDLAVFMYYFHSNKKMKPVSKVWIWACLLYTSDAADD